MRQWIWVSIGLDNGLSPILHQAIILTTARILSFYQALFWLFVDQIDLRLRLLAALSATQYASPRREA